MTGYQAGLEAAQIGSIFSRARVVFAVNVVNALILAFFLRNAVSPDAIAAWVLSILIITAARFGFLLDYEQKPAKPLEYWKRISVWGSALSGIVWGMATIILFPAASLLLQIFLPVVMMGMMAGSAVSWHAYFPAFKAYFLPVALLTLARFAEVIFKGGNTQDLFVTLGAMFLIFSAGLYLLARQSNRVMSQLLLAKSEKDADEAARAYCGYPISLKHPDPNCCMVCDTSERKLIEQSNELASLVFQESGEAIMVTDENRRVVEVNAAFTRITGYAPGEIIGADSALLQSGTHDKAFLGKVWQAVLDYGHWQGEIWSCRKNGDRFAQWANISVVRHPDGAAHRFVVQFSDITEKKKKDELIWLQAHFDMLTNLPNRRLFRDKLIETMEASQRFALLFIDLDRFKEINDTMGHDMGDLLLVEAAMRIGNCLRKNDTVARLGGDEFTVILPDTVDPTHLGTVVRSILEALRRPLLLDGESVRISASIGLTLYPDDAGNVEDLLKNADQAMYGAKAKGGNCYEYFTESMQKTAFEKITLTRDLRLALERKELEIYYQPIVELKSGRIAKAEVLLRWMHGERGMIGPDLFVPLAEESGLIVEIGEWLFDEAASRLKQWQSRYGKSIALSINKSPLQFAEVSIESRWPERLEKLGLPRNSIAIEITEGLLIAELAGAKRRLLAFHEGGIEVSIDDFGTGFSSFAYLKQFEVDYLKIDRSFVSGLAESERDMAITEGIISMARKLGIRTIAEGVETVDQRDLLSSFGCDYAQGFLYSPPVPGNEFEDMLRQRREAVQ